LKPDYGRCELLRIVIGKWVHIIAMLSPGGSSTEDVLLYVNGVLEMNVAVRTHEINTAGDYNFHTISGPMGSNIIPLPRLTL
jgi:hypothetical protein